MPLCHESQVSADHLKESQFSEKVFFVTSKILKVQKIPRVIELVLNYIQIRPIKYVTWCNLNRISEESKDETTRKVK